MATESPNQAMLLRLISTVGAVAALPNDAASSSPKRSSKQMLGARRCPATGHDGWARPPRLKSPRGMFIKSVNQRNSGGMNSPNGTR
ncbi:hypothetical protein FQZ97_966900 [compost metagenome]